MNKFFKLLFLFSLLALFFAYGYISHWKKIFPYQFLNEANIAFHALVELYKNRSDKNEKIYGVVFWDESGLTRPVARTLSPKGGEENILVLGHQKAYRNLCPDTGCMAWITDRKGNILHAWKNTPDLWVPLENREGVKNTYDIYPVGAYLYPNGDILVSYQGSNLFPIAMGLAKFDKDSDLIWKRNGYYHHWFSIDNQGGIYIPSLRIVESPLYVEDHDKYFVCHKKQFQIEMLAVLDSNGNLKNEIDIYRALLESDLAGVFHNNGLNQFRIQTCDPMHLNDVRILSQEMSHNFPRFAPGDLLLSFRSLNAVGVLDRDTNLFKWFYIGAVHNQHSPRFYGDNSILIFDNLGGRKSRGISRVVGVDVSSGSTHTVFPKPNVEIPSSPFFSRTAGHIDIHPNQGRILVSWTHQGIVWEIDVESGEVLWEYVNTHPLGDRFGRIFVNTSIYVNHLDFTLNGGKIP